MTINGGLYVDGGLFDNLPAKCIRGHCDLLVGSHCNHISQDFDSFNLKKVIERSMLLAIYANTQSSQHLCDLLIEPPRMDRFGAFEIAKAKEIFDFAYHFTKSNFMPHHFQHRASL